MDRRNFIKTGTFIFSAGILAKLSGFGTKNLFAKDSGVKNFSIDLITDNPDQAVSLIDKFIKENMFKSGIVKYSEYDMEGSQIGDLAFFENGKLLNYKINNDNISQQLKNISNSLNLPKEIQNPHRIKFYTHQIATKATKFMVIHRGVITSEIPSGSTNKNIKIDGSIGNLTLQVEDNKLKVTASSCRHKTCIQSKEISKTGDYIVCIPNEIVIMAE